MKAWWSRRGTWFDPPYPALFWGLLAIIVFSDSIDLFMKGVMFAAWFCWGIYITRCWGERERAATKAKALELGATATERYHNRQAERVAELNAEAAEMEAETAEMKVETAKLNVKTAMLEAEAAEMAELNAKTAEMEVEMAELEAEAAELKAEIAEIEAGRAERKSEEDQ